MLVDDDKVVDVDKTEINEVPKSNWNVAFCTFVIIASGVVLLLIYYGAMRLWNKGIAAYKEYKKQKQIKFKQFMLERKETKRLLKKQTLLEKSIS